MPLTAEEKKLWVEALRSGDYKQTKGTLHNLDDGGFCCLGLGALVLNVSSKQYMGVHAGNSREGPQSVYQWWANRLGNPSVNLLTRMNDRGDTFDEIADWIDVRIEDATQSQLRCDEEKL